MFLFYSTSLLPGKTIQAVCEPAVETVRSEEVEPPLQTVDLNEEAARPEPTDGKVKEENKPRRTPLMAFLRQMVSHFPSIRLSVQNRQASHLLIVGGGSLWS